MGLRDRVQMLRRVEQGFALYATIWARVQSVGPGKEFDGKPMTHTVVVRFRSDVMPGDRFVHRGRNLDVLSADDLTGRRAFLACRCAEAPSP